MTIFLATASNPGMNSAYWTSNINSIQASFNKSASVDNWKRVTDNAWLVEARDGVSAQDVNNVVSSGLRWTATGNGSSVEAITVAMSGNPGFYTTGNSATLDWLKARELEAVQRAEKEKAAAKAAAPKVTAPKAAATKTATAKKVTDKSPNA